MQFTETEARWFIGIAIILGCAFVALLCDYLKGVNERLRERAMELLARNEEMRNSVADPAAAARDQAAVLDALAELRRDMDRAMKEMTERTAAKAAPPPPPPPAAEPAAAAPAPPAPAPEPKKAAPAVPPMQPAIATLLAATSGSAPKPNVKPIDGPLKSLEVPKRVASLPGIHEILARAVPPAEPAAPAEEASPNVVKIRVLRNQQPIETEKQAIFNPGLPLDAPAPQALAPAEPPVAKALSDPWSFQPAPEETPSALAPEPPPLPAPLPVAEAPMDEAPLPVPVTNDMQPNADGSLALPAGMHDRATLDFLLAMPAPFTGLVVSIGINDFTEIRAKSGEEAAAELVGSIAGLVTSLTANPGAPDHFACKVAADEFVICYNGEIGPIAQRRMSALSERLWDFQLRSMGTFSVVFSWGATEANEESLADAIDAASERMRETRQNRASMGGGRGGRRLTA